MTARPVGLRPRDERHVGAVGEDLEHVHLGELVRQAERGVFARLVDPPVAVAAQPQEVVVLE